MHFFSARQERAGLVALLVTMAFSICGQAQSAEEKSTSDKPKVIEFYASWCEPCRRLQPAMDRARAQYSEEVEFVSVNVDDPKNREMLEEYEVCPIPTLVFVDKQKKVASYAIGCTEDRNVRAGIRKILPQTVISATSHELSLN